MEKLRRRIFDVIQIGNKEDFTSRFFDIFIATVIVLNILVLFLKTFQELAFAFPLMNLIETVTIIIFCGEYALRIWTSDFLFPEDKRGIAIIKFVKSYDGVIELLTILPFFFLTGFVVFRMLRVVRIFHLFRINAQYDSFNVITTVLKDKRNQIVSSLFIIIVLMFASSLCMYSAEHDAQPEAFRNAFSGLWWSMSTLLTVGYGDIYPITVSGKIMGIIIAFLGVGVVAIPTGIISAGFVEQYTKLKRLDQVPSDADIRFITVYITEKHNWNGLMVQDMGLPQGLTLAMLLRNKEVVVPFDGEKLREGDKVVLAAESFVDLQDAINIYL